MKKRMAFLEKCVREWQERLRLQDVDIKIKIGCDNPNALMEVHPPNGGENFNSACIHVDEDYLTNGSEADISSTVAHELTHILMYPFVEAVVGLHPQFSDHQKTMLHEALHRANEKVTYKLESVFRGRRKR